MGHIVMANWSFSKCVIVKRTVQYFVKRGSKRYLKIDKLLPTVGTVTVITDIILEKQTGAFCQ